MGSRSFFAALPLGLSGLYIILAPNYKLFPDHSFSRYDEQRLLEVVLLLLTALSVGFDPLARKRWMEVFSGFSGRTKTALGLFFFLGLLSSFYSAVLPYYAWQEISLLGLLFILIVAIAAQVRFYGERAHLFLVGMIFIAVTLVALRFLLDYLSCYQVYFVCIDWTVFFRRFAQVRFFNQFQTWTFPLLALPFLWYAERLRYWRFFLMVPNILWWTMWFYSGGRGTGLAMLVSIVGVLILFRGAALPWLFFQGRTLLMGAMLYFVLFHTQTVGLPIETITGPELMRTTSHDRLDMWLATLKMVFNNPLLGIGPQHYAFFHPLDNAAHPHNATLQLMAEWGILALMATVYLLISGFHKWLLSRVFAPNPDSVPLILALTASFIAGIAHAQVSGILVMPLSQVMGALMIGMMLGLTPQPAQPSATLLQTRICSVAVLVMAIVLVTTLFPDVTQLQANKEQYIQNNPGDIYHPRFWNQGLIDQRGLH